MFVVKERHEASNKTIRLPDDLIEKLEKIANEKNLSFSGIIVQCCEYALEHLEK